MKELKFSKNFLWGSATSAYQVEGGIGNADWSEFKSAGQACDHYNRFKQDFDIASDQLNQNAHRLSLEWSRIEPEEGKFNQEAIDHYKKVLQYLKDKDMETMVTLHHFTTPLWMSKQNNWTNKAIVSRFVRYAKKVVKELGSLVDFLVTINEPLLYAHLSYRIGKWPPQKESNIAFLKVVKNQLKAHKQTYTELHKMDQNIKIGIVKNNQYFDAYSDSLFDSLTVKAHDYIKNNLFLNLIEDHFDFIGLNYYFHNRLKFPYKVKNDNNITTDLGWEIFPEGIYHVLLGLDKYDVPVYITENGLADSEDKLREDFIKKHLYYIHKAIEEGVDVRGYFHWSLLDNFEWAEGFEPRFGLVEVDYDTQKRKIRDSAKFYARIAKENKLNYPSK